MTTKAYLRQAFWLDKRIDSKLEQLDSLRQLATKATSTITDMPRGTSPDPHRMECILAKIADMSTEIEREIDELVDLKHEIAEAIYLVDNPELRALLELRYACFKPWSAIAEKLGYSERRVYELHGAALKKIVI